MNLKQSTPQKIRMLAQRQHDTMEFMRGAIERLGESMYRISLTQAGLIEYLGCEREVMAIMERIETERKEAYELALAEQAERLAKIERESESAPNEDDTSKTEPTTDQVLVSEG